MLNSLEWIEGKDDEFNKNHIDKMKRLSENVFLLCVWKSRLLMLVKWKNRLL